MTFRAASQLYAVPAGDVREIVRTPPLVRVPLGPKALLGLGNLRGSVLPVAGLARLLGRSDTGASDKSRVIVLEGKSPFGLMVDEVDALLEVSSSQVKAAEAEFSASEGELLKGVFRAEDSSEPVKILDLQGLLARAFGAFTRNAPARSGAAVRQASREAIVADDRDILIVFEVGGQEFALPIASVIEVLRAPATTTALPHSETAVLGMVGLRDALLPLMSLQALLGLSGSERSGKSKGGMVIVAAVGGATVGLAADSVQDIIRVDRSELEPVPVVIASRTKGETRVQSVIKADGGRRLIAVLSPDQLFREDIMTRIRQQMPTAGPGPQASANTSERIFLVFTLGGQEYGLAISAVEEVARLPDQVTKLPRSPDFLKGVINLRGSVLPIIDQRRRFELPEQGEDEARRLVVIRIGANIAGFIVDGVSEVLRTAESAIEAAPDIVGGAAVLEGVLNLESSGRMILLLDPSRLLSTTEKGLLDALGRVDEAQSAVDQDSGR